MKEVIKQLLDRELRCPTFEPTTGVGKGDGDLDTLVKESYIDVNTIINSLLADLKTLNNNGCIRYFSDSYSSNIEAIEASRDIFNKYGV